MRGNKYSSIAVYHPVGFSKWQWVSISASSQFCEHFRFPRFIFSDEIENRNRSESKRKIHVDTFKFCIGDINKSIQQRCIDENGLV